MAHLPCSYGFESLTNAEIVHGPIWDDSFLHSIFGLSMVIKADEKLMPQDLIQYQGTIYIIPANPEIMRELNLGIYETTVIHDYYDGIGHSVAMCLDRELWFALNREVHRMKHISIPGFVRPHGVRL